MNKVIFLFKRQLSSRFQRNLNVLSRTRKLLYSIKVNYISMLSMLSGKSDVTSFTVPPREVQGMTELDRTKFKKTITVISVNTSLDKIYDKMKNLKTYILKIKNLKPVIEEKDLKIILLNPNLVSKYEDLEKELQEKLSVLGIEKECFKERDITLNYENFSVTDILSAVLPTDVEGSTAYSMIGHICHLNLREHLHPHRTLIGKVLLDKVSNAKSVVNKTDVIDSTFRYFKMEVLAGIDDMNVMVKENGCTYQFDFSKVYWNSRLSTEHLRIVEIVKNGDYVYDVFAGVGPFTVPAAKKKCHILANDLNPQSYESLLQNIKKNNVANRVEAFNLDGRVFLKENVKNSLVTQWRQEYRTNSSIKPSYHIIMNLPAIAMEFLDVFVGLFHDVQDFNEIFIAPIVYCYCFSKEGDAEADVKKSVRQILGSSLSEEAMNVFFVRKVAPNKKMMRVSFELPANLLQDHQEHYEPAAKRNCSSE